MFSFIKNIINQEKVNYEELMPRGTVIIDVRTPQEFAQGHVTQSINIPLGDIKNHVEEIKKQNKPIITCCRSGARSGVAAATLRDAGVEVYNGGSWNQVQSALNY